MNINSNYSQYQFKQISNKLEVNLNGELFPYFFVNTLSLNDNKTL